MGRLKPHTFKKKLKNKDAVETGYFATIGGGGQCGASYAVGSSPKSGPPSRVRLLLLIACAKASAAAYKT